MADSYKTIPVGHCIVKEHWSLPHHINMSLRKYIVLASLVMQGLVAATANAQTTSATTRVGWIAGCWTRTTATSTIEEQWMVPRGGALIGMSRTTVNGAVREYEFLRIFAAGDTLVYAATPSGQTYTEFRSINIGAREVTFENLKHDFPQRIGYKAVGRDSLIAFIEGPSGGKVRHIDYPYARAACPSATPSELP